MRIVSNTGPIIGLAKVGRVLLLKDTAEEVLIPPFVHKELFGRIGEESGQIELALADCIRVVELPPWDLSIQAALADLDEGERQALRLAVSMKGNVLLLMDDRAGRTVAHRLGIPTMGLVGLLLSAKERGLLRNVGAAIEELRAAGYWLSDEVLEAARRLAGE